MSDQKVLEEIEKLRGDVHFLAMVIRQMRDLLIDVMPDPTAPTTSEIRREGRNRSG